MFSEDFFSSKILVFLGLLLLGFTACLPDEEPIEPPDLNSGSSQTIQMGPNYTTQHFYSLEDGTETSVVDRHSWDLAFDCKVSDFHIWLNTAKGVSVAHFDAGFDDSVDLAKLTWHTDAASGNIDSNAIGKWGNFDLSYPISAKQTYIVNRGKQDEINNIGYVRFRVDSFSSSGYHVSYKKLNSSATHQIVVPKESEFNFTYLSLEGGGSIVNVAPMKSDYELLFTRYTDWAYNIDSTIRALYQVTGVLVNPERCQVAKIENGNFELSDYEFALSQDYSAELDAIGYDWKELLSINPIQYRVDRNDIYLIRVDNDQYFKLRFLRFTNDQGLKGYPQFEFTKL